MIRFLLDTSAYSAFMRRYPDVIQLFESAESLYLNPVVLAEVRAGFLLGTRREKNERALREFLQSSRVTVLPIDDETADRWAVIAVSLRKAGTPISSNDIWIAASAMQYGLPILTSDSDFQKVPQVMVRHFSPV
ncbi:MAG: type II toxin-antitoxin system VapC family toxin [Nitrospirota bacterium]|nr:type II toxin-antitoxin system VapC family toxin [Nitrospirota bacterium]MDE3224209.1 type II toxin-antitoxin system VapC family toxin [Nitrospirota bacterium]MDE3242157.1 type II toxin-antitoxin system VapC family toxin [Nitrospirota bacterium]